MRRLRAFFSGRKADMVWNTLVTVSVLLPLLSMTIDIPRYFRLRSTLQAAADAAAEAAARCVDVPVFYQTGDVRLDTACAHSDAYAVFDAATASLRSTGYYPALTGLYIDESQNRVEARAQGTIRLFFGLSPRFTVRVEAWSRFRMPSR